VDTGALSRIERANSFAGCSICSAAGCRAAQPMQLIAPGPAVLLASALAARPAARGGRPFCMGGGFGAAARDTFKYSGKVRPGKQSPKRSVPKSISKPDYWKDGQPKARGPMLPWQIQKKSEADIEGMRAAGRIAREVLDLAGAAVAPGAPRTRRLPVPLLRRRCRAGRRRSRHSPPPQLPPQRPLLRGTASTPLPSPARPGVTTEAIDALVHEAAVSRGAYPSPLNYHGFPKSCCTSVNEAGVSRYSGRRLQAPVTHAAHGRARTRR